MKRILILMLAAGMMISCTACSENKENNDTTSQISVNQQSENAVPEKNYLILVNRTHKIPDNYEKSVEIIDGKNFFGTAFKVEKETYEHFQKLREKMMLQEVQIEINRSYLNADEQKDLIEEYKKEYGDEYAYDYQGDPGYSENQTGLGIDLALFFAGEKIDKDKDLLQMEGIFKEIHAVMADYGFILRYPEEKVKETDFMYQPWHIRYVGEDAAKAIYEKNITLEEYLLGEQT